MLLIAHSVDDVAWSWSWDPLVVAALVASAALYALGLARIRRERRGPRMRRWEIASYFVGWLAIVAALLSPIDALSSQLFSVHMVQHELLMIAAAPLMVLGRPLLVWLWAFDGTWRDRVARLPGRLRLDVAWRALTGPFVVWVLHGLALWVWHVPRLYDAALTNEAVHALEHLCFFGTALLFWWALVHGRYGRFGYGLSVVYVFTTALHSTLLGALLTVAPRTWYPAYAHVSQQWGLSPLEDQQVAGLVMWVPSGVVLAMLCLALFAAWVGESGRRVAYTQSERIARAPHPPSPRPNDMRGDGEASPKLAQRRRRAKAGTSLLLVVVLLLLGACTHQPAPAPGPLTSGDAERGREAFRKYGCISCHTIPGVPGANALVGPPLTQMGARAYIAGRLPNSPENLLKWIQHPQQVVPGNVMPDMNVTDGDGRDMAAYLYTLR